MKNDDIEAIEDIDIEDADNISIASSQDAKKKQLFFKLGALGVVIVGVVAWRVMTIFGTDAPVQQEQVQLFKNDDLVQSRLAGEITPELNQQKTELYEIRKQNAEMMKQFAELKDSKNEQKDAAKQQLVSGVDFKYSNGSTNQSDLSFPKPFQAFNDIQNTERNGNFVVPKAVKSVQKEEVKDSLVFDIQKKAETNSTSPLQALQTKKRELILPPGALIQARLIGGVRAPTLTKALNEPQPVSMIVTSLASLPNRAKLNIKECIVKGEAKGDLSTESVYIRTNYISCVTNDGEVLVSKLSGTVYGKSGVNGIGGVVVSKQGALLGRALIAGFVNGFANAANSQYQNTLTSTTGTLTSGASNMSAGDVAKSGAYGGIASGGTEMSKFYMDMVKQIEPSIEIKANIDVDILITDPSTIEIGKKDKGVVK